jgi:hypothetical protein
MKKLTTALITSALLLGATAASANAASDARKAAAAEKEREILMIMSEMYDQDLDDAQKEKWRKIGLRHQERDRKILNKKIKNATGAEKKRLTLNKLRHDSQAAYKTAINKERIYAEKSKAEYNKTLRQVRYTAQRAMDKFLADAKGLKGAELDALIKIENDRKDVEKAYLRQLDNQRKEKDIKMHFLGDEDVRHTLQNNPRDKKSYYERLRHMYDK